MEIVLRFLKTELKKKPKLNGPVRELNPGPLAP